MGHAANAPMATIGLIQPVPAATQYPANGSASRDPSSTHNASGAATIRPIATAGSWTSCAFDYNVEPTDIWAMRMTMPMNIHDT